MAGNHTQPTSRRRKRHDSEQKILLDFEQTLRSDLRTLGLHIDLCDLHPNEVDGYKSNHGYDVVGGGVKWIVDENGRQVAVDATTVEAAALARARLPRDEHSAAVARAERCRDQLLVAWSGMLNAIDAAKAAQTNTDVPDVKHCQSCLRAGVKVGDNTGDPLTWSGAHLPDKQWLCEPCRRFTSEHERLPSLAEVQDFNQRGRRRWRALGESATRNVG